MREPTIAEFAAEARKVIDRLPELFGRELTDIVIKVEEFATAEQLASVGLSDQWDLTGLYEGIPLPERSQSHSGTMPPVISLFRQPLLEEMAQTGVGFSELVHHVVIHEAGHHFGFSDEEMHALEDAAEE
ncbi:MAG: neutral zinc metallopeptidase [Erythrobacter sp.]|nr:neutral zinc metallopeptidase [Erythrobacter sp.]